MQGIIKEYVLKVSWGSSNQKLRTSEKPSLNSSVLIEKIVHDKIVKKEKRTQRSDNFCVLITEMWCFIMFSINVKLYCVAVIKWSGKEKMKRKRKRRKTWQI